MSDNDQPTAPIGENVTPADDAVTPIDTPVEQREDGESRPRPNEEATCPVLPGAAAAPDQRISERAVVAQQVEPAHPEEEPCGRQPLG